MFLFPFLKELFITKDKNAPTDGSYQDSNSLLKKMILVLGCMSIAANFYLVTKLYVLGRENIELRRQVKDPAPRPVLYPEDDKAPKPKPKPPVEVILQEPVRNKPPKPKRPPSFSPTLPPDNETYLKELDEINKIQ